MKDRPRFTNVGSARIRGFGTWHLRHSQWNVPAKGMSSATDLYIEHGNALDDDTGALLADCVDRVCGILLGQPGPICDLVDEL